MVSQPVISVQFLQEWAEVKFTSRRLLQNCTEAEDGSCIL